MTKKCTSCNLPAHGWSLFYEKIFFKNIKMLVWSFFIGLNLGNTVNEMPKNAFSTGFVAQFVILQKKIM